MRILPNLRNVLVFLVVLSPIVVSSQFLFDTTSVRFIFILLAVLGAVFGAFIYVREGSEIKFTAIDGALAAFFIAMLVSLIGVPDLRTALWSGAGRATGVTLYAAFGFWYFVLRFLNLDKKILNKAAVALVAVAGISTLVIFFDYRFLSFDERAIGLAGNAMILANYLAPYIFFVFFAEDVRFFRSKYAAPIFAALIFLGVYLTQTRSALLGLAAGIVIAGGWYAYKAKFVDRFGKKMTLGLLIGLFALGGIFTYTNRGIIFGRDTLSTRLVNWSIAVRATADHPIFGWGWENYRTAVDKHFDAKLSGASYYETRIDKPHNIPLEILVTMGVVGLATYIAIILFLIRGILAAYKKGTLSLRESAALLGVIVVNFVQGLFAFDTPLTLLLIIFVCAIVAKASEEEGAKKIPKNVAKIILAGALVVSAVMSYVGITSLRQLYYINKGVAASNAKDVHALHDIFQKTEEASKGAYFFETWRWFAQSYLLDFATGKRSLSELSASDRVLWEADTNLIAEQTKAYLAEYRDSAEWQTFGGKIAYYLALAKKDAQYLELSERAFLRALELSPNRQEPTVLLAYVYTAMGKNAEAVFWYVKAAEVASSAELESAREILAAEFVKTGDSGSIITVLTATAKKHPSATVYAQLAAAYAEAGEYILAREAVETAVELDGTFAAEAAAFIASFPQK